MSCWRGWLDALSFRFEIPRISRATGSKSSRLGFPMETNTPTSYFFVSLLEEDSITRSCLLRVNISDLMAYDMGLCLVQTAFPHHSVLYANYSLMSHPRGGCIYIVQSPFKSFSRNLPLLKCMIHLSSCVEIQMFSNRNKFQGIKEN